MTSEELKERTKQLALKVIDLVRELPSNDEYKIITNQVLRSSFSTGANLGQHAGEKVYR